MTVLDVTLIISVNVALIFLWGKYRQRKISQVRKKVDDIYDLIEKGKYDDALLILSKTEKLFEPEAYAMIGECHYGMGDKEKAYSFYMKALSVDRTMDLAYLGLGKIEMDKGDYVKAESSLIRAIEIVDNNYVAMYYLAKIYNIWGKYLDAARLLEDAIAKGLILRDAYIMLHDNYMSAGNYVDAERISKQLELLNERGN